MTKLELWNFALACIPQGKKILSDDEDSTEADYCRMFWDAARVKVLSTHNWTFATRSMECSGGLHQGVNGARWVFPMPAGSVKIVGVFDPTGRQVEALGIDGLIVTQEPMGELRYVTDIEDTSSMPDLVQIAIAWDLAAQIAPLVTSGGIRLRQIAQQAAIALGDARQADTGAVEGGGYASTHYADSRR